MRDRSGGITHFGDGDFIEDLTVWTLHLKFEDELTGGVIQQGGEGVRTVGGL